MVNVRSAYDEIRHMVEKNDSMRATIDKSRSHLREMYAFLRATKCDVVRPTMHKGDHPLCCGVPMWMTKAFTTTAAAEYSCMVCLRKIVGARPWKDG